MSTKTLLAALAAATCLAAPAFAEGIEVHDAYAIASRMGAASGAAFMTIHNHGETDDHLIGASAPVSERVELHTHIMDEAGVARMVHVPEGWDLPAGGEILLQRGAEHIMFIGITDSFEDGDIIPLTLIFEKAGEVTVNVEVDLDRLGEMGPGPMNHGEGGMMNQGTMNNGG